MTDTPIGLDELEFATPPHKAIPKLIAEVKRLRDIPDFPTVEKLGNDLQAEFDKAHAKGRREGLLRAAERLWPEKWGAPSGVDPDAECKWRSAEAIRALIDKEPQR